MIIDAHALDALTSQAKASSRLRMNLDLRNSPEAQSNECWMQLNRNGTAYPSASDYILDAFDVVEKMVKVKDSFCENRMLILSFQIE